MRTALVATGGTIAWHNGYDRMLSGSEVAATAGVRFDEVVDVTSKPSWDFGIDDMEGIARAVCDAIDAEAEGVVVTHGTDTLEETAWLTDVLLGDGRADAGIVFTGAMRFADHEYADGPRNLAAAVAVAARASGVGVQVSFAGRIHAARWVRKIDAAALDPFLSGDRPETTPAPPAVSGRLNRNVAVLKVGPVSRPPIPDGIDGLVLEGTGADHVPSQYHDEIVSLVDRGVPVVVATRIADIERSSFVNTVLRAGDLTAEKAAIALMAILGTTQDLERIRTWWEELLRPARGRRSSP